MGRYALKKKQTDKKLKHMNKTKRKTKDIDEIHEDLKPKRAEKLLNQDIDLDKPGSAQHYCLTCA